MLTELPESRWNNCTMFKKNFQLLFFKCTKELKNTVVTLMGCQANALLRTMQLKAMFILLCPVMPLHRRQQQSITAKKQLFMTSIPKTVLLIVIQPTSDCPRALSDLSDENVPRKTGQFLTTLSPPYGHSG